MNIQDWGALAELIGAVAVVATLIFLTTQIRLNTNERDQMITRRNVVTSSC